ncbi:MAG: OmpP1/FadL family transporter [Aureispira sp.]
MKVLFLLVTFLATTTYLQAQEVVDALLFSETQPTITARSMGVGNALGALGGDLSTASRNPAGLAIYRRAELSFSLGSFGEATKTDFFGTNERARQNRFAFGSAGLVIPTRIRGNNDWKMVNFGITFNRLANFDRNFSYSGTSTGSRVQAFADQAQGLGDPDSDPYQAGPAYQAFLMDDLGGGNYIANGGADNPNALVEKSQTLSRSGGINELGLSLGGNYNNKLYIAASLGVNFLNFREDRLYNEYTPDLKYIGMDFTETRSIEGTGINLKLGVIYRINKMFRIGAAVHTPTVYRLTDSYNTGLNASIIYNDTLRESVFAMEDQDPNVLQHNMATPWTFMVSGGVILGKRGFIGVDVEYLDFGTASFTLLENERTPANNQFINEVNNNVEDSYKGVFRARIGGEYALGLMRLRLGYQFQSSPYEVSVEGVSDFRHDISAGIGVRWKHFYIDAAYQHTLREFAFSPYATAINLQRTTGNITNSQVMLTLGVLLFRD